MRKSKGSHIKCDCGKKTPKCEHLQQPSEGHTVTCCFNHGGCCSCSVKPESSSHPIQEAAFEAESAQSTAKPVLRRRRAHTALEPCTADWNDDDGRAKPTLRLLKTSLKCGPYSHRRAQSMQGGGKLSRLVTGSADDLRRPKTSARARALSLSLQRGRCETASPTIGSATSSTFTPRSCQFSSLDVGIPTPHTPHTPLTPHTPQFPDYPHAFDPFTGLPDHDTPLYSAGLSSAVSVDWGQYDGLEMNGGESFAPSSFGQSSFGQSSFGQAYASFDLASTEPTLAPTSGDVSDADDFPSPFPGAFSDAQMESFKRQSATHAYMRPELGDGYYKAAAAANEFLPNLASPDALSCSFPAYEEDHHSWPVHSGAYPMAFRDRYAASPVSTSPPFWEGV